MPDPEDAAPRPALEPHVAAFFAVLVPPVSGIAMLKLGRPDPFVRFHAMQSAVLGTAVIVGYGALYGLALVMREFDEVGALLTLSLGGVFVAAWVLVWLIQMGTALLHREWHIPLIGRIARRLLARR